MLQKYGQNVAKKLFERRLFLQAMGFGGASLLLEPIFTTVLGQAMGTVSAAPKKRLLIFGTGNGIIPENLNYNTTLLALKPYQKNIAVATNLHNTFDPGNHGVYLGMFTCYPGKMVQPEPAESIDQTIARSLGASNDAFGVLSFGLQSVSSLSPSLSCKKGVGQLQALTYPSQVIAKTFATLSSGSGSEISEKRSDVRGIILDQLINADNRRLINKLAPEEKKKVQSYIDSVDNLLSQFKARESARQCQVPKSRVDTLSIPKSTVNPSYYCDPAQSELVLDFLLNTVKASQACGLNRVATIGLAPYVQAQNFVGAFAGAPPENYGILWHVGYYGVNSSRIKPDYARNKIDIIEARMGQILANYWSSLKAYPDLQENTLLLWLSPFGGSHHNGVNTVPVVMLAGDSFKSTLKLGETINCSGRSMREFWVTIANAMGCSDIEKFGSDDGKDTCNGRISALMA